MRSGRERPECSPYHAAACCLRTTEGRSYSRWQWGTRCPRCNRASRATRMPTKRAPCRAHDTRTTARIRPPFQPRSNGQRSKTTWALVGHWIRSRRHPGPGLRGARTACPAVPRFGRVTLVLARRLPRSAFRPGRQPWAQLPDSSPKERGSEPYSAYPLTKTRFARSGAAPAQAVSRPRSRNHWTGLRLVRGARAKNARGCSACAGRNAVDLASA